MCFIVGYYPKQIGGAEFQAKIIAQNLFQHGHDIIYISYGLSNSFVENGIQVYGILPERLDRFLGYHFISKRMESLIDKIKPDLIYHRCFVPYSYRIVAFAEKKKIPCYFHIADEHSIVFNNSIKDIWKKMLFRRIANTSVNFIFQTKEQYKLVKNFNISRYRVIGNMQEMPDLQYIPRKKHKIVWIGKSTAVKQLQKFIELAEKCVGRFPYLQFVVISRFFSDEYSQSLLQRISRTSNICNLGEQSNDFINDYLLNEAFLLVNTSISEGISNTYIQAWARGVPVISLNSNPNRCFDSHNIGIYCHNDENLMYESVVRYYTDVCWYEKNAQDAISYAKESFSVENVFPSLLSYMGIE